MIHSEEAVKITSVRSSNKNEKTLYFMTVTIQKVRKIAKNKACKISWMLTILLFCNKVTFNSGYKIMSISWKTQLIVLWSNVGKVKNFITLHCFDLKTFELAATTSVNSNVLYSVMLCKKISFYSKQSKKFSKCIFEFLF